MLKTLKVVLITIVATGLILACGFLNCAAAQVANPHYGWQRTVKLDNLSIRVFLAAHDTGAANYSVILFIGKIAKGKHPKLSNLKVELRDAATRDSAGVWGPVKFSGEVCDKCPHEKNMPSAVNTTEVIAASDMANSRLIDLIGGNAYGFEYAFKGLTAAGLPAKLAVQVQFNLSCDGKTNTVRETFDCQRRGKQRFVSL